MASLTNERRRTLSPGNQFHFSCPVFNAEVGIASCLQLREAVWRGQGVEQRKGCQVALHACKCPINHIIKRMERDKDDPYYAGEKRVGHLKEMDLERIAPVLVDEKLLDRFNVSGPERRALLAANDAVREGATARKEKADGKRKTQIKRESVQLEEIHTPSRIKAENTPSRIAEPKDALLEAAITGDFSAAISAAVAEKHSEPHTIPPADAPHDNPRMPGAQKPAEPLPAPAAPKTPAPAPSASGKPLSLLERAKLAQQRKVA